jgi:hypothetical protein
MGRFTSTTSSAVQLSTALWAPWRRCPCRTATWNITVICEALCGSGLQPRRSTEHRTDRFAHELPHEFIPLVAGGLSVAYFPAATLAWTVRGLSSSATTGLLLEFPSNVSKRHRFGRTDRRAGDPLTDRKQPQLASFKIRLLTQLRTSFPGEQIDAPPATLVVPRMCAQDRTRY